MTKAEIDNRELQLKIGKYGDMLFKLSLLRLQNPQDAEDVVQEVFYQYIRFYGTFQSEEHEKAWLLKTTVNACRKVWRSAWKRHRSSEEWTQILEEGKGMQEGTAGGPEEGVLQRETEKKLLEAVLALPVKYRDVIHLFYYQGLSVREIAQATGSKESTVTSQLTRGREILKRSLKEEYDFG